MIEDVGGRFRSRRTNDDFEKLFKQELDSLAPDEKEIAFVLMQDLLLDGNSPILQAASFDIYRTPPVSMEQFLTDEYFLGRLGKSLYDEHKKSLTEVFNGNYSTAILGGAIGLGKSSWGSVGVVRMLYEVSCLKSVQETYGIAPTDTIVFPCVAARQDTAEREIVDKIRGYISESKYFQYDFKPISDTSSRGIEFPGNIIIPPGASTENAILGGNAFGGFIDEANFFQGKRTADGGKQKRTIRAIYEGIKRRIASRFVARGKVPGIIILASSKQTANSFTEEVIRESVDDPRVFVFEAATYEVAPPSRFSEKKFKVAIGNESQASRILGPKESNPEGMVVIEVPEDFRRDFEADIDAAIRDVGGYSTIAITPFITKRELLNECIDYSREHPFHVGGKPAEIWEQSFQGRIKWEKLCKTGVDGALKPLLNPNAARHVHLDLSKSKDHTGLVISHISGQKIVQRVGQDKEEIAPEITVDFILSIQAQTGGDIIYSEIRKIIYEFSQHGFFIKLVSADSYQSAALLQTLSQQGYATKVVSVDHIGPYGVLKNAIYEGRLKFYNHSHLLKELRGLQKDWKTGKVDHQEGESKDCADGLAGTVATLTESFKGYADEVVVRRSSDDILVNEDSWVLEDPSQIHILSGPDESKPMWRQNAEKALEEQKPQQDWKTNFQSPFVMG